MPPSGRKAKAKTAAASRKAAQSDTREPSDSELPEVQATPSRSSKKRARQSDGLGQQQQQGSQQSQPQSASRNVRRKIKDTRGGPEREGTEGTEAQEQSDAETEPSVPTEADIIAHLKTAERQVNATEDYANDLLEGQENVPGYGKIAGRDWAFIIRKVEVNIGRPEAQERMALEENGHSAPHSARTSVDIDLGPDRQVSRSHAIISYDPDSMQWFIIVNGRNGVRADNNFLKRGTKSYLRNGSVIEIAGTQMAFITTAAEEGDGPVWDASIVKQAQKSSEDDEGAEHEANGRAGFQARSHLQDATMYGSAPADSRPLQQGPPSQQRSHPHSQRGIVQGVPGTPIRSSNAGMKSSPAANYARGVMMESTETIDYSAESAKDLKPPHSYAQLIGMAILSTQEQQMTLSNIYKWIMANYAFYRFNTGGWQNSIRHNLSLNKAFAKIARRTDEPGKGMKWMIEPSEFDTFVQQGMKGCRRPGPIATSSTSNFGSPASPLKTQSVKEEATTPRKPIRNPYPPASEAYTPERGPKQSVDRTTGNSGRAEGPDYDFLSRSTPRNGYTAIANAAGSPPTLYEASEDNRVGALDTPFPLRPSQRLAPPSSLKRPSDFIQFSSPAPFWKMEGLVGSTPFKAYDLSPLKTPFGGFKRESPAKQEEAGGDEKPASKVGSSSEPGDVKPKGSPVINSSSPPASHNIPHGVEGSPTLSRPATAVAKTLSQLAAAGKEVARTPTVRGELQTPPQSAGGYTQAPPPPPPAFPQENSQHGGHAAQQHQPQQPNPTHQPTTQGYPYGSGMQHGDEGEDEGIDLAKGFQPIGAFHTRNHMAMSMGIGVARPASSYAR